MAFKSIALLTLAAILFAAKADAKISCITCSTLTDRTCGSGQSTSAICADTCYARYNDGQIQRGCFGALTSEEQDACTGWGCVTCDEENCNNFPWRRCYSCDPTQDACSNEQVGPANLGFCSKYISENFCFSRVLEDGGVARGCGTDQESQDFNCLLIPDSCAWCWEDGCNRLPKDQLKITKCQRCSGLDADCVDGNAPQVDCPRIADECYVTVNTEGNVQRGCMSYADNRSVCVDPWDNRCTSCLGEDGCNDHRWLLCHQCREMGDGTCASVQNDGEEQACSRYSAENRCFERLESEQMVRGCENDLGLGEDVCKGDSQCRTCDEAGCNKEVIEELETTERCLQCSQEADPFGTCWTGQADSQPCAKLSTNKCYSKVDDAGSLHRGCFGDLTADEGTKCTEGTCVSCEGEGCNNGIFPADRLSCYQCKTTPKDKRCAEQLTGDAMSAYCKVYRKEDQCYSRTVDGVFERGCASNLNGNACEDLSEMECSLCSGSKCNSQSESQLEESAGAGYIRSGSVFVALFAVVLVLVQF